MKKTVFVSLLLILALAIPITAAAGVRVGVNIGIPLPPPIVFAAPPEVVPLPYAVGVYAVPGVEAEIFFWNGWWWRPWNHHWYRSRYYDRGWGYYNRVPTFYSHVDPRWRGYYRDNRWGDRGRWEYERIPHNRLNDNWRTWHNRNHWERNNRWNVERYRQPNDRGRRQFRTERQRQSDGGREHRRPER